MSDQKEKPVASATDLDDKILAGLRARFALLGHELYVVRKGGLVYYEVRRWGHCRTCSTLHDLQGFLAQIGGAA
jgi:hypothetical protein